MKFRFVRPCKGDHPSSEDIQLTFHEINDRSDTLSGEPGPVAQSDGHPTCNQEVVGLILRSGTILSL